MLVLFLLIFHLYYIQYVEVGFFEDLGDHSWKKVEACLESRLSLRGEMNLFKVIRFEKECSLLFEVIGFRPKHFDIPPANH